ncbi:hypothetical protein WL1483_474 [Aeromonas schubertii]|uniref:Uncharacterized protein n=1 Tax=Aeromonas schubertii TaxID=652 RepID=A0A0S2SDV5_9GAMM|nr:hypothetical protein WL1483_474 [Aeromonas schubertii]
MQIRVCAPGAAMAKFGARRATDAVDDTYFMIPFPDKG